MSKLSAYLHVPFCKRKCNYCDFYSAPPTDGAVSSYAKCLCEQIRNSSAAGESLYTVYVGGGTPSLLSQEDFTLIVRVLRETFDCSHLAEFTVECNPESVSPSLVEAWRNCGVDRVSMGVQSFRDPHLRRLGRLHDGDMAKGAYRMLRQGGVSNISLDLMAALPDQTLEEFESDLFQMVDLSPEHLSVYLLSVEPDSVFGREGVRGGDEDLQHSMYLLADRILCAHGYEHYEISNFAKPGMRAKHNGVYWAGEEYLAFGAGASGFYEGIRYRIPADTAGFCAAGGRVSPIVEEILDEEGARLESLFLGLRLSDGIDRSLISAEKLPFLHTLCREGLGTLTESRFSLTPQGFLVSDYVISQLMAER